MQFQGLDRKMRCLDTRSAAMFDPQNYVLTNLVESISGVHIRSSLDEIVRPLMTV